MLADMKISSSPQQKLGTFVFALGVLSSIFLTGALAWPGLEAESYGFERYTNEHFDGLSCPFFMTRRESGVVQVDIHNPSNQIITPIMTTDLSAPGLPETYEEQVSVPPGETRQLEYKITSANIDRYYFVFAKANRSPSYPLDTAEATCGVLVLDIPFLNGAQILATWLGFCLICQLAGLWLWRSGSELPGKTWGAMRMLAIVSLGGILPGLYHIWLLALVGLVLTLLALLALLRSLARP